MVISDSFLASGPSGFCKPDVWDAWCYIAEKLSHVVKIFFFFRTFRLSMHFCLAINYKPTFTKVASILCSRRCKIWRNSRLKSWCPRFRDVSKTDFGVSLSDLKAAIVILVLDNTKLSNSFSLKEWQRQTLFDLLICIMNRGSTVFCFSTTRRQVKDMEPALATTEWVSVSIRWSKSLLWGNDGALLEMSPLGLHQCGLCFRLLTRRHARVELAASLLCSERLFPCVLRRAFPRQKTNIWFRYFW